MVAVARRGFAMTVPLSFRVAAAVIAAFAMLAAAAPTQAGGPRGERNETAQPVRPVSREDFQQGGPSASVVDEINALRANPRVYVENLHDQLASRLRTRQLMDAFTAVAEMPPAPPLRLDPRLGQAAWAQAQQLGLSGLMTHTGAGGSTPGSRIREAGVISTLTAEELAFGQSTAQDVVLQLILDAGVPGAPHRRDLLNPVFTMAGAACGPHKGQRFVCVIDLSNNPTTFDGPSAGFTQAMAPVAPPVGDGLSPAPNPADVIDYDFGGIDDHLIGWRPDLRGLNIAPMPSDPMGPPTTIRIDGIAGGAFDGWLLHDLQFGGDDAIPAPVPTEPELSPEPGFPARDSAYEPAPDASPPQEPVIDPGTPM